MKQKITTNYEKRQQKQRWEINRLNSQEIVHAYKENIDTQIDKTEVREDINEEWTNIKTTIVNSAKEIIGIWKKERNDECREVIVEKNKAKNKCLNRNTRINREDYEQKRSEARNLFKKKKRELLKKKIEKKRDSKEK